MQSMIEENERLKSESSIDDLPDLLLTDIFQRLPMNSVFRSKCVSKRWLSLISDPLFAQSYASRQQSLSRPFALFYIGFIPGSEHPCEIGPYCPPFEPESLTFPLNFFTTELQKRQKETCALQLIGSSSDLLLFSGLDQSSSDSYCVCNPLTFQWITLPQPPRRRARYPVVGFMVEGDGTFWVVQILPPKFPSSRLLVFQVYCSGRGKWCSKKVACPRQFESFWAKTTVVYQGIILWMVNNGLLAFDPKTTLIGVIDLPTVEMGRFGVSCGRLHYYEVSSYYPSEPMENPILRVWMMINFEGGEWVLQHSIRYDHLWSSDESLKQFLLLPNTEKYFRWVSSHPIDSEIVFLKCDGQLVTCKMSSACLEVLPCDTKQGIFYRLEWDVIPLVFKPWPTAVVLTSDEIVAASTP
ncbi:hypothetical protein Pfo_002707 [Paulownia fortunei]|nr:hypothetical protein Pfo_002707 [Paulownia fortunei]